MAIDTSQFQYDRNGNPLRDSMPGGVPPSSIKIGTRIGLMTVQSPGEAEAEKAIKLANDAPKYPAIPPIVGWISSRIQEAKAHKEQYVEPLLLDAQRRRNGEYSPERLAEISKLGGSQVFMFITRDKCLGGEAWLIDSLLQVDAKPWLIDPNRIPDLPDSVKAQLLNSILNDLISESQNLAEPLTPDEVIEYTHEARDHALQSVRTEARKRADAMEHVIEDQMKLGRWEPELRLCISDMVTYGTCIMKGPFVRMVEERQWVPSSTPGSGFESKMVAVERQMFERVNPFNFYPEPSIEQPEEGYCVERILMRPDDMRSLKKVEGYRAEDIEAVLMDFSGASPTETPADPQRKAMELKAQSGTVREGTIECWRYVGTVAGKDLKLFDAETYKELEDTEMYSVEGILVGKDNARIIQLALKDKNDVARTLYDKAVLKPVPGSFWGIGVPLLMSDVQDSCNSAARALFNNMAFASGPQTIINDITRLPPGDTAGVAVPMRVWEFNRDETGNSSGKPVDFFMPQSRVAEFLQIYDRFLAEADTRTGFPAYSYGSNQTAKGSGVETLGGLKILYNSSARGIKGIVQGMDEDLIKPKVQGLFDYNMAFNPDESIKGASHVVARGSLGVMLREQQQEAITNFLSMSGQNPVDAQIVGPEERAVLYDRLAELAGLPDGSTHDIDSIRSELRKMNAQQSQGQLSPGAERQPEAPPAGMAGALGAPVNAALPEPARAVA